MRVCFVRISVWWWEFAHPAKTFPQPQRVVARIGEIKLTLAILLTVKLSLFLFLVSPTCRGFYTRSSKLTSTNFLLQQTLIIDLIF